MYPCWRSVAAPKEIESEEERLVSENGALLLEALIASFDRRYNPIRIFSTKELEIATNNYAIRVSQEGQGNAFYKGYHENRDILVKKYMYKLYGERERKVLRDSVNEIVVASQMNNHRNSLKLLGCCLGTEVPICVYEFAHNGRLFDHIFEEEDEFENPSRTLPLLSWKNRLRIATETANALTYLHNAFQKPIIHRHIKAWNVSLDKDWAAKLTDFSLSIAIPLGKTHVHDEEVRGTWGFNAPEYFHTGLLTEKSDVFSFGILMLEILTGQPSIIFRRSDDNGVDNDRVWLLDFVKSQLGNDRDATEIVAPSISEEERTGHRQQLQEFLKLAVRCTHDVQEERPTMMEVTKELRRIQKFSS